MRKTLICILTLVAALGLLAGVALAQGQGHGPPNHSQAPGAEAEPGEVTVVQGDNTEHVDASDSYAAAVAVDTVTLGEGHWKITATGAVTLDGTATALNCGLRTDDDDQSVMIAKQNPATGGEDGRVGFSVVGDLVVDDGEAEVDLVCYGGNGDGRPFEHNLVAVGG